MEIELQRQRRCHRIQNFESCHRRTFASHLPQVILFLRHCLSDLDHCTRLPLDRFAVNFLFGRGPYAVFSVITILFFLLWQLFSQCFHKLMTCCPTDVKPVAADPTAPHAGVYGPNQSYYYVEPKAPAPINGRMLIIPDIFGFHHMTLHLLDKLASTLNIAVILPDFFNGKPWDISKLPPPDMNEFYAFLSTVDYEKLQPSIENSLKVVMEKSEAAHKDPARKKERETLKSGVTVTGFCWGAKVAARLAHEKQWVNGVGLIHPSFLTDSDAKLLKVPTVLVPSNEDTPLESIRALLQEQGVLKGYLYADDVHHGFCAARFQPEEKFVRRVDQTFALLANIAL